MSHGQLESTVVEATFWPSCANCTLRTACQTTPRHPAYPHRWHWSSNVAHFPETLLILRSWVGSSVYGQAHTGCASYTVDPQHLHPLQEVHLRYLTLETEKQQLEAVFHHLEQRPSWTKKEKATFTATFQRYKALLAEQAALRTTPPAPVTVAVNH